MRIEKKIVNRLCRNGAYLLAGNGLSLLLGFVVIAIMARELGPEEFGVLIIIQAYVLFIDRAFNFQSWQMLIKYGAEAHTQGKNSCFNSYVRVGCLLDVCSAIVSFVVAEYLILLVYPILGLDIEKIVLVQIYAMTILFNLTGAAIGVLRIFDKFKLLSWHQAGSAIIKLTAILWVVYDENTSIENYIYVMVASEVLSSLSLAAIGYIVLKRLSLSGQGGLSIGEVIAKLKKVLSFSLSTNLSSTIRAASSQLDILIVGAVLGPANSGFYKIIKQVASMPGFLVDPLYSVIYPEFSRLWSVKNKYGFRYVLRKNMKIAFMSVVSVLIFFIVFGEFLVVLVFGNDYIHTYWPIMLYMFSILIAAVTFPFSPAMLVIGYHKTSLYLIIICTVIYLLALYFFTLAGGLVAASAAYLCFYIPWSLSTAWYLKRKGVL